MEPSAEPTRPQPRLAATRTRGLSVVGDRSIRGALVGGALGAVAAGLAGVPGGLLWIVLGVWTLRWVWGSAPGVAWGIACLAAGLRWGTLGLGDVQAATRLIGPTLVAGPPLPIVGAVAALSGALTSEAASAGLRSKSLVERVGAAAAVLVLVPAYCAPGPGAPDLAVSLAWWTVAAAVLTAVVLAGHRPACAVPPWIPAGMAVAGTLLIGLGRL